MLSLRPSVSVTQKSGGPFLLTDLGRLHEIVAIQQPAEVMLGYPAPQRHRQAGALGDNREDLGGGQVVGALQVMDLHARPSLRRRLGCPESQCRVELHRLRLPLEGDVVDQPIRGEGNDRLESAGGPRIPPPPGTCLPLPDMPAALDRGLDLGVLEANLDPHGQGVVEERVEADQEVRLDVDSEHDRDVEAGRVEAKRVLLTPPALGDVAVLDLQSVLVSWAMKDLLMAGREEIGEHADQDAIALVDRQMNRGQVGAGVRQTPPPRIPDGT